MASEEIGKKEMQSLPFIYIALEKGKLGMKRDICTVEPIFNDISNSDKCCYNNRFANPRFSLYLSHTIYFYNDEYKKSLSSVITKTRS